MSKTPNLFVPERRLMMADGQTVLFRADHRAWLTLERHTGESLSRFLEAVSGDVPMRRVYDLAWALSATHRAREQDSSDFEAFLERIPPLSGMGSFLSPLMELLGEAFRGEASSGNAPAPARPKAR